MTPEERNLIAELFDRLATLEDAGRDPDAERAIKDGLRQAPNAAYALVQTVLVQDEALKRTDARIRELEGELGTGAEQQQRPAGFLDNMRNAVFGRPEAPRAGSVPSVRPPETPWGAPGGSRAGMQPGPGAPPEPMRPGGSFLGTAAAAAAGMIGGSLLLDGIRSMTGGAGHRPSSFGGVDSASAGHQASSPWSNSAGSDLSRQAGLDDIGRSPTSGSGGDTGGARSQGLFDTAQNEADDTDDAGNVDDDFDSGDGGFDLGGGDDSP